MLSIGPVTKWTEAPLMVPPSLPMQQPVALSSFIPIFVDESFSQNTASSKSSAPTPMDSSVGGRKPGMNSLYAPEKMPIFLLVILL